MVYSKFKSSGGGNQLQVPFVAALGRFISEFKVMVRTNSSSSNSENVKSSKELVIGEPFECEYIYDVLMSHVSNENNGSSSNGEFKLGRQEDAQELLSYLLNRLHEEMVKCLESLTSSSRPQQVEHAEHQNEMTNGNYLKSNGGLQNGHDKHDVNGKDDQDDDEWREVGRKNRAFVTRKVIFFLCFKQF